MRPLKFRAWDVNQNTMLYNPNTPLTIIEAEGLGLNELFGLNDFLKWLANRYELMQFTGLYDQNGKEIYERDIVTAHNLKTQETWKGVVGFEVGMFTFSDEGLGAVDLHFITRQDTCEVIGNIYENPTLIHH